MALEINYEVSWRNVDSDLWEPYLVPTESFRTAKKRFNRAVDYFKKYDQTGIKIKLKDSTGRVIECEEL
jgi:hypothetical protein